MFKSNGGNDTIVGTLRPQDVIELLSGKTLADYGKTTANGMTTLTVTTIDYIRVRRHASGGPGRPGCPVETP